jgi:hypothetical protein
MTKAFDSPSKNMLRTALMRLAVPPEWCDWFIKMDMEGGVIPKSLLLKNYSRKESYRGSSPTFRRRKEELHAASPHAEVVAKVTHRVHHTGMPFLTSSCEP